MNKVILMGRLTRDPEVRYSSGENSVAVAKFSLAVERKYKRGEETAVDFINCTAFGKTAENIGKYFAKGRRILISGRIQVTDWTDSNGHKRRNTDVIAEEFEFCESKGDNGGGAGGFGSPQGRPQYEEPQGEFYTEDVAEEDLPF